MGLTNQVRGLVLAGAWARFFSIEEMAFREITLEVLTSFYLHNICKGREDDKVIQFWVRGEQCTMSITEFSQHMGLYDGDYYQTPKYHALPHQLNPN